MTRDPARVPHGSRPPGTARSWYATAGTALAAAIVLLALHTDSAIIAAGLLTLAAAGTALAAARRFWRAETADIPHHWWGVFAVWSGGLGIWGAVALAAVVGAWRVRRCGADVKLFMDAVAPALLVAQAIGRIGNYFNQELFGRPTSLPWGVQIAPQFRPAGYAAYPAFQPTFLYELIFDLALAATLVWLGHHRPIRPPGLFALYVAGYSAFRIFEESLRIDSSEHFLGLRLNFYIACALMLFGLAWFARTQRKPRRPAKGAALLAIGAILCAATAGCGHPAHPGQPAAMAAEFQPGSSGGGPIPLP